MRNMPSVTFLNSCAGLDRPRLLPALREAYLVTAVPGSHVQSCCFGQHLRTKGARAARHDDGHDLLATGQRCELLLHIWTRGLADLVERVHEEHPAAHWIVPQRRQLFCG